MSDLAQTIVVALVIALAAGLLLRQTFFRRTRPGCGCSGCPAKAPPRPAPATRGGDQDAGTAAG